MTEREVIDPGLILQGDWKQNVLQITLQYSKLMKMSTPYQEWLQLCSACLIKESFLS